LLPDYLRVAHFDYCSSNLYIIVDGDEALLIDARVGFRWRRCYLPFSGFRRVICHEFFD
jgi:hypothetical protein